MYLRTWSKEPQAVRLALICDSSIELEYMLLWTRRYHQNTPILRIARQVSESRPRHGLGPFALPRYVQISSVRREESVGWASRCTRYFYRCHCHTTRPPNTNLTPVVIHGKRRRTRVVQQIMRPVLDLIPPFTNKASAHYSAIFEISPYTTKPRRVTSSPTC